MCVYMCAHIIKVPEQGLQLYNYEEAVNSSSISENSQVRYPLPKCHIVCIYVDVHTHMPTYLEVKVLCYFGWSYLCVV